MFAGGGAKSDIENVGRTGRHGTFLGMLGNFSFGDYYKREAIAWAWEFVTERVKLDREKLYVTVHLTDDEAQEIWEREIGLPRSRISRWDEDNFWTMGPTGPCGPCSEIFYDTGPQYASTPGDDAGPNKGNRFVELWNVVFQQYNRGADGQLSDLPRKAIDTGAGLERMLAIASGKESMYETDLFTDLIDAQPDAAIAGCAKGSSWSAAHHRRPRARGYDADCGRGLPIEHRSRVRAALPDPARDPQRPHPGIPARVHAAAGRCGGRLARHRLSRLGRPPERGAADARSREEQSFIKTLDRGSEILGALVEEAIADCTRMIPGAGCLRCTTPTAFHWN